MSDLWNGKKVLIVDSLKMTRTAHSEVFESLGFHIVGTATNGIDCLQKIDSLRPDIVTLDIAMEMMDGIECAKILSREHSDVKFIFITKMTQDKVLNESLKTNFPSWLFMSKPLEVNQLHLRLKKIFVSPEIKTAEQGEPTIPQPPRASTGIPKNTVRKHQQKAS